MINDSNRTDPDGAEPAIERIEVTCYAGHRGEETPRWMRWGRHRLEVLGVVDRWQTPQRRCFKCRVADGAVYTICQERATGLWHCPSYTPAGSRC